MFLFVLCFTLFGFADAMYIISRSNSPNNPKEEDDGQYKYYSHYF